MSRSPRVTLSSQRAFWRVFLYGVGLLAVTIATSVILVHLIFEAPPWHRVPQRLGTLLATRAAAAPGDPGRLQAVVESIQTVTQSGVAVDRADGTRLAAAGTSPPAPLAAAAQPSGDAPALVHRPAGAVQVVPFRLGDGDRAYLLLAWPSSPGSRITLHLLTVLAVLIVVSLFAARRMVRPLEQLTDTAKRLADGDLSVRTGLDRKDEVGALARTMDEMAERLAHRIRSEKELLANISHEIRTPLARIRVALELCTEEDATLGDIRRQLDGLQGDVGELEQLVDDVLVAARLDLAETGEGGGPIALRPGPVELAAVAEQAARRFAAMHPGGTLAREVPADLPRITADAALLRRVLDNLLDNAAKYGEPGAPVELTAAVDGEALRVEVRDRGIGVAAEDLPRLFEPFFRTERSRSRTAGGTGLGLTLCQRIVEAHGGRIAAAAREGGGTVLWFEVPVGGPPAGGDS